MGIKKAPAAGLQGPGKNQSINQINSPLNSYLFLPVDVDPTGPAFSRKLDHIEVGARWQCIAVIALSVPLFLIRGRGIDLLAVAIEDRKLPHAHTDKVEIIIQPVAIRRDAPLDGAEDILHDVGPGDLVETVNTVDPTINNPAGHKMKVTIGSAVFTAILTDNATAAAFREMLPLTITMEELNGNEKFYYFQDTLPSDASPGGNIQPGDLMLYGNNCLVLFYEGFSTSYSYTRIGHIENGSGLADALGSGNATLKFEMD